MSDALNRFNAFYDLFRKSDTWRNMLLTREDSPWHREENVAEHTRMVLDWYHRNLAPQRSEQQIMLTSVMCLFHDVGKPRCEVVKTSEERGTYRSYTGHELVSSRMWVDYALTHRDVVSEQLRLSLTDISALGLMIEYHVPFNVGGPTKQSVVKQALLRAVGSSGHTAWLDGVLSDQYGRHSDAKDKNIQELEVWMARWETLQ